MTSKIENITVSQSDNYFFDTNIWIFLFAPIAKVKEYKQRQYSKLLNQIKNKNALIWINSLVISEYINSVLRLEFSMWKETTKNINANYKKDFRPTEHYYYALDDIRQQIKGILSFTQRKSDDFNSIDINNIISNLDFTIDFGDAIIVDMCNREYEKGNKIKLVTDDKDITGKNLPFDVITA